MSRVRHRRRGLVGPAPLLAAHTPGSSWLHRLPPGPCLAALALLVLALALLPVGVLGTSAACTCLVLVLGAYRSSGVGLRTAGRQARALAVVLVAVGAYQLWQAGWVVAVGVPARLLTGVLAATLVTTTTPAADLLDLAARAARPLRHLGLPPERVALVLGLAVRTVPHVAVLLRQTRDAAEARGLERDPRALVVPAALRVVAHGQRTGDALAARGLGS